MAINVAEECKAELARTGLDAVAPDVAATAVELLRHVAPLLFNENEMSAAVVRRYQPVWLACAMFVAKGTRAKSGSPLPAAGSETGLSLSRVLTVLKVPEPQFFRELDQFLERSAPALMPGTAGGALMDADAAADLPRHLNVKPLASMYILSSWSANRYRIMFARFFKAPEGTPVFDFGWLIFIVAKQRLLPPFTDLVSSVSVLACCISALLASDTACKWLRVPLGDSADFSARDANGKVDVLASLCTLLHVPSSTAELSPLMKQVDETMQAVLSPVVGATHVYAPPASTAGVSFLCGAFDGLLDDKPALKAAVDALSAAYEQGTLAGGECNERNYAAVKPQHTTAPASPAPRRVGAVPASPMKSPMSRPPLGRPPASPLLRSSPLVAWAQRATMSSPAPSPGRMAMRSPLATPMGRTLAGFEAMRHGGVVATPIRGTSALVGAMWLKELATQYENHPSPALKRFIGSDVAAVNLQAGLTNLAAKVFTALPHWQLGREAGLGVGVVPEHVQMQRRQAVVLHFSVLESMMVAQEAAAKAAGAASYDARELRQEKFHKAVFACACEVIQSTSRDSNLDFPVIHQRLKLFPAEMVYLVYVIEKFVRHAPPDLPAEQKRHLNHIERKVLQRHTCSKDSSFHAMLAKARPPPAATSTADDDAATTTAAPMEVEEAEGGALAKESAFADGRTSAPASPSPAAASAAAASAAAAPAHPYVRSFGPPGGTVAGADPVAEKSLRNVLAKTLQVALEKSVELLELLDLDRNYVEAVAKVMEKVVYIETHLLYNRHLDVLLLCAMYMTIRCLATSQNLGVVKLKRIMTEYEKLDYPVVHDLFRTIVLEQSPDLVVKTHCDLIRFYNEVFIPTFNPHMSVMKEEIKVVIKEEAAKPPSERRIMSPARSVVTYKNVHVFSPTKGSDLFQHQRTLMSPARSNAFAHSTEPSTALQRMNQVMRTPTKKPPPAAMPASPREPPSTPVKPHPDEPVSKRQRPPTGV